MNNLKLEEYKNVEFKFSDGISDFRKENPGSNNVLIVQKIWTVDKNKEGYLTEYQERLYTMAGLDKQCKENVEKSINNASSFGWNYNKALQERVTILKERLSKCEKQKLSTDPKIDAALNYMQGYVDQHIAYKQQTGVELRTGDTKEALEYMDCSEFVARYLINLGVVDSKTSFATNELSSPDNLSKTFDNLDFVNGSEEKEFNDIQPGYIFVWSESPNKGHTGIIKAYDKDTDIVTVIESLVWSGTEDDNVCKNCTRESNYKRDSKSLAKHPGWIGYYKPKLK
jgi:hypothetical protein